MKTIVKLILSILLLCLMPMIAFGEDYSAYTDEELLAISAAVNGELQSRIEMNAVPSPVEDFIYASNGKEVRINAYTGSSIHLVIPDEIGGVPVTRLYEKSIRQQNIQSVQFPAHLKEIGKAALSLNYQLTGVLNIPASVETIGAEAFTGAKYTGVVVNSSFVVNGYNPFYLQEAEFLYIREGCSPILGAAAFSNCSKMKIAIIPESVTKLDAKSFTGCNFLTIVTPEGSAAYDFAMENFFPVDTENYALYAAQYAALYPLDGQ